MILALSGTSPSSWPCSPGSQYSPQSFAGGGLVVPLTVTFTRRARRTTIHPATVDGLWVAAVTGHYTAARCHTPGRLPDSFQRRNNDGAAPFIELWPETKLETLFAQKSYLAAAHGLR